MGYPTFFERYGVYFMLEVDWNSFSAHTKVTANDNVGVLLTYDEFYWTICIETSCLWKRVWERNDSILGNEKEFKHQYFDFPCFKNLYGKELACKFFDIWACFKAFLVVLKG
jgi:hypothetical protein